MNWSNVPKSSANNLESIKKIACTFRYLFSEQWSVQLLFPSTFFFFFWLSKSRLFGISIESTHTYMYVCTHKLWSSHTDLYRSNNIFFFSRLLRDSVYTLIFRCFLWWSLYDMCVYGIYYIFLFYFSLPIIF